MGSLVLGEYEATAEIFPESDALILKILVRCHGLCHEKPGTGIVPTWGAKAVSGRPRTLGVSVHGAVMGFAQHRHGGTSCSKRGRK